MPVHQVAFICSGLLLVPIAVAQVIMRRQVHDANYGIGSPETSPWDVRYINAMFGERGIWNAHTKAYERSALRTSFVVLSVAWLASALVAVLAFLIGY